MKFESQEEYEKEKQKWQSTRLRQSSPAGYERFLDAERAWEDKVERDRIAADAAKKGQTGGTGGGQIPSSMKITGNGDGYKGDTSAVNLKDLEFQGYNKVMSGKDIEDPGTKFAKKGNFKKTLDKIEGKFYDKDGNLLLPKFDMPDRVKLTKEQKAANDALDSQFDDNGFYKMKDLKMPTMSKTKVKKPYKRAAKKLSRRMGIDIDNRNNGRKILRQQGNRYNQKTKALTIPDFSLSSNTGQNMLKIGQDNLNTKGMRT